MLQIRAFLIPLAARLLLRLAVATIRLMQWLYRHRLISEQATERFFRTAKRLERHGTAVRSQIIQGLAVAVDAGWAIGGRFYQTFGINRRG